MKTNHQNRLALVYKENSLRVCGDHVNLNDWWSILNGISQDQVLSKIRVYSRCYKKKVLEQINSEGKLEKFWHRKGKKLHPVLFTDYLLCYFVDALGKNLKDSSMLRILILDGIPLSIKYLETLSIGLSCNENLRTLSLSRCGITDAGCCLVLDSLETNINLQKLNFTSCNLTGNSGYSLSVFIKKRRQLFLKNEWAESTGSTENSKLQQVRGLHTLILNRNPEFSDFGLRLLVDVLKQDFWLRVLRLRSCGLSSKGEILELLRTNCTIKTIDFRQNNISSKISEDVKNLWKRRKKRGERISMKKRLLTKELNFNGERKMRKKLIKSSRQNNRIFHKNRISKRIREKASTRKNCKTSASDFNQRTKSISGIKNETNPKISSENRKEKFMELKLHLSNIIDCNQKLSQQLKINRELLAKEYKSRLKIMKCCDTIEPEVVKICSGILVHVVKDAKNNSGNLMSNIFQRKSTL